MLDIVILCFIVKYVDRSIGFKTFRAGFSKTWALKKKIVTPFSLLYLLKKKVVCMSTWTWNYIGFGPKRSFLLGASGSFFSFKRVFPADSVVKKKKNTPAIAGDARDTGSMWGGKIPWRKAWQPTPIFLPRESHGQRSLASYNPWGRKESNMTEQSSPRKTKQ